jgi:uncharacterized membrane protein YdjX (TVP38/TMEM64 family)
VTKRRFAARSWPIVAAAALVVLALAALAFAWRYTPLSEFATVDRLLALVRGARTRWWTPIALIAAYPLAALVMFPRPILTLCAVVTFGPAWGVAYALAGILMSGVVMYSLGRLLPERTLRRLTARRIDRVSEALRERGLVGVIAVSLVPVAPFVIVGMVAGAIRIKPWHFLAGSLFGHLPGTLATAIFGQQMKHALEDPDKLDYWMAALAVAVLAISIALARRRFARRA